MYNHEVSLIFIKTLFTPKSITFLLMLIFEAKIPMTFLSLDLVDLLDHFIILICKAPNGIFGFIAPAREERLGRLLRNLDEL